MKKTEYRIKPWLTAFVYCSQLVYWVLLVQYCCVVLYPTEDQATEAGTCVWAGTLLHPGNWGGLPTSAWSALASATGASEGLMFRKHRWFTVRMSVVPFLWDNCSECENETFQLNTGKLGENLFFVMEERTLLYMYLGVGLWNDIFCITRALKWKRKVFWLDSN